MKPISVRFQCFGPYMAEQFVDFSELEKNGLFLICGETGAGKTTVLDAICYALYGESSGGQRGDLESMRCKLAEKADETFVEFIFDSAGQRYKFTRSLKYKTKVLHSYHTCYVWKGGVWEVLDTGIKPVTARARGLLGLTSSQFRQVIILPQGKFEEFLVSDSDKKEEILATLFDVQQWGRISEEISRRVHARAVTLDREKTAIAEGLRRYGCAGLEALAEKAAQMETELDALIPQAKHAEAEEKQAREILQMQQQVARDHQELAKKQKAWEDLKKQEDSILVWEQSLTLADHAEQIREEYEVFRTARRTLTLAREQLKAGEADKKNADSVLERAARQLEIHLSQESAMQEKRAHLLRLENAKPVYENLNTLRAALTTAEERFSGCETLFLDCQSVLEDRERTLADAFDAQKQARETYDQAQIRYRLGIGGILAATLEEGRACPVCGSLTHPAPAKLEPDPVSEAQLDKLAKAMTKADKEVSAAMKARSQAEAAGNSARNALSAAHQSLTVAQTGCRAAEAQKIAGIETTQALTRAIRDGTRELENWETAGKKLLSAHTAAQGSVQAAALALEKAGQALIQAQANYTDSEHVWETARDTSGFADEQAYLTACLDPREKQRRRERVNDFRSDLKAAQTALEEQKLAVEGHPMPDIPALKQALSQAETIVKALGQRKILLESDLNTLRADERDLTARMEKNREALIELESDQVFARRLSGRNGVSLQRYVLGVMMNSIAAQANRLLENVYGGRYRLHRTDETTGRTLKGGLELEVSDSHNNQRRSVRTLSGGEKFLVALSLAIGLSTVVQAQGEGIRLEAMFIDEGFGSLDREAIQDALDILQGIRRTAGVVGIISHVEALAETIPARLEITKGSRGSSIRLRGI